MLKIINKLVILTTIILSLSLVTFAISLKDSKTSQNSSNSSTSKTPARFVPEKAVFYLELNNILGLFSGANSPQQETVLDIALDLNAQERADLNEARLSLVLLPKQKSSISKEQQYKQNAGHIVELMRLIHSVEATYQAGIGNGNFGTNTEIFQQDFIDGPFASALGVGKMKSLGAIECKGDNAPLYGYFFKIKTTPAKKNALATFTAVAIPALIEESDKINKYSFFVDETGVIRISKDIKVVANASSEPLNEIFPSSNQKQDFPFTVVGLLETPNAKTTNKLASFVAESFNNLLESSKVKIQVSDLPKTSGNVAVIGLEEQIQAFLADLDKGQFNSLSSSTDFQKLQRNDSTSSNLLVYTNGVALREIVNSFDLRNGDRASYEVASKLLGLEALKATALNFGFGAKGSNRLSALVDKDKPGLLPMFASVALSDFHLAKFASSKSQIFFNIKVDPKLTYNSILQAMFPNFDPSKVDPDPLSTATGVNLSQDIFGNLTGEIALSFSVDNIAALFGDNKSNNFTFKVTAITELKNVETFSKGFSSLVAFQSKDPVKTKPYKNTTIYEFKDLTWAYSQNLVLIGNPEGVQQTLDSISENNSLANTPGFQNNLKQFSQTGLGLLYLNLAPVIKASPNFGKLFMVMMLGNFPAQISVFAGRDKDELFVESSLKGVAAPILITAAITGAIAIPNLLASRRSANAATAVESMRLIHSVETTYQAGTGNGKFGTAEDLFYQDLIDPVLADALGVKAMKSIGEQQCLGTGLPKSGYKFSLKVDKKGENFQATATPVVRDSLSRTGDRSFFVDATGVIRYTFEMRDANADDRPVGD